MNNYDALFFVVFWSISIILFYKWYKTNTIIKVMKKINCKCSDVILRTTYQKSEYVYFYTYRFKNEEYTASDKARFKLFFFNPKINDKLEIYINPKEANKVITPLALIYYKLQLIIGIVLIILPFLLTI